MTHFLTFKIFGSESGVKILVTIWHTFFYLTTIDKNVIFQESVSKILKFSHDNNNAIVLVSILGCATWRSLFPKNHVLWFSCRLACLFLDCIHSLCCKFAHLSFPLKLPMYLCTLIIPFRTIWVANLCLLFIDSFYSFYLLWAPSWNM